MAGLTDIIVLVVVAGGAYWLIASGTLDSFVKSHLPAANAQTTDTTPDTSGSARQKSGAANKGGKHAKGGGGGKGDKGCYTDICGGRHHCSAGTPGCCCGAQAKCGSGCH